jgi:hypothetical protein
VAAIAACAEHAQATQRRREVVESLDAMAVDAQPQPLEPFERQRWGAARPGDDHVRAQCEDALDVEVLGIPDARDAPRGLGLLGKARRRHHALARPGREQHGGGTRREADDAAGRTGQHEHAAVIIRDALCPRCRSTRRQQQDYEQPSSN